MENNTKTKLNIYRVERQKKTQQHYTRLEKKTAQNLAYNTPK